MDKLSKLKCLSFLRILLTFFTIFFTNISLFSKSIILIVFDTIDYNSILSKYFYKEKLNNKLSNTITYDIYDKINDILSYSLILIFIYNQKLLPKKIINILTVLLFIRIVGTILFLNTNNTQYFFYFPNFFLEFLILFTVIYEKKLKYLDTNIVYFILIILKIIQEYSMHYNKNIRLKFQEYSRTLVNTFF